MSDDITEMDDQPAAGKSPAPTGGAGQPLVFQAFGGKGKKTNGDGPKKEGRVDGDLLEFSDLHKNHSAKSSKAIDEDHLMRAKLVTLTEKHRDLDDAITALERAGTFDQLQVQRLKKQKLTIKDEMSKLKAMLHPDIIA